MTSCSYLKCDGTSDVERISDLEHTIMRLKGCVDQDDLFNIELSISRELAERKRCRNSWKSPKVSS